MTIPTALNPIPWLLRRGGFDTTESGFRSALAEIATTQFKTIHTSIPAAYNLEQYRSVLDEFGLRAGPGFFAGDYLADDSASVISAAGAHARELAELGVDSTFVGPYLSDARTAQPGVGAEPDHDQFLRGIEVVNSVCDAMAREGIRAGVHPHIGAWLETEEEIRELLDNSGPNVGFGPDTGHLIWARADIPALLRDYNDRLVALHVKDVDMPKVDSGLSYWDATFTQELWTEPGFGSVDFDAVFEALGEFYGWAVIEVDVPRGSALTSTQRSADWVASRPELTFG